MTEPTDEQIYRYVQIGLELEDPRLVEAMNRMSRLISEQYELSKAMGSPSYSLEEVRERPDWETAKERQPWTWPKHGWSIEMEIDGEPVRGEVRFLLRPDRVVKSFAPESTTGVLDLGFPFRWRHAR